MKILLTNLIVSGLTGTEQHTRTLARALSKRGHSVAVYSPFDEGRVQLAALDGLRVCRTLAEVEFEPDILHCHHLPCAIDAVLAWPERPALFVVHDATAWHDALPPVAALDLVAAVDQRCADRAAREAPGIDVRVVANPIDLDRIPATRRNPRPRSLVVYGKSGRSFAWNRVLQLASGASGIWKFRALVRDRDPLGALARFDVVLARARCAMEAVASGAYTVVFDRGACGGAVTPERVEHLLRWNFGGGVLDRTLDHRFFRELMRGYSADAALESARMLRPMVAADSIAARFESLYRECIAIRSERSPRSASLNDQLLFARGLAQSMAPRPERLPGIAEFFGAAGSGP